MVHEFARLGSRKHRAADSHTFSPVSTKVMYDAGKNMVAIAAKLSASWRCIHNSFGPVQWAPPHSARQSCHCCNTAESLRTLLACEAGRYLEVKGIRKLLGLWRRLSVTPQFCWADNLVSLVQHDLRCDERFVLGAAPHACELRDCSTVSGAAHQRVLLPTDPDRTHCAPVARVQGPGCCRISCVGPSARPLFRSAGNV